MAFPELDEPPSVQLEQMRIGRRLEVRWQVAPEVKSALIPQLLLQPLIENAVVHGIANAKNGGWIEIEARLQQMQLVVVIRNSIGGASQPGLGVGISNTKARLKYLYDADATFEFEVLYVLRTKTGKQYHVTRTYRDGLKGLAQYWTGTDGFGPS